MARDASLSAPDEDRLPAKAGLAMSNVPLHGKALPPFAALRAFEAVGRLGGVRKAAATLNHDHTVISRHIHLLETWLGVSLFLRSGGRLTLTPVGRAYHGRVSAALAELALATADLVRAEDQQTLRVWSVPGFAAQWLSDQIAEFERIFPDYAVELRPTDTAADILMHEADVDIRFYGDSWPPHPGGRGVRHLELARPPVMAVASPRLAAKLGPMTCVEDLLAAPLIHEEHYEQWRHWLHCNGVQQTETLHGPLLWHAHLAIGAAKADRGIALASRYLVGRDLDSGALVEIRPPGAQAVAIGSYGFVAREDRWSLPIIKRFRDFLQSKIH